MRRIAILAALLAVAASEARAKGGAAAPAQTLRLTRDLTRLPSAKLRMVQTWEQKGTETREEPDAEPASKDVTASNRLTYDVEVGPAASAGASKDVTAVVRRIEMKSVESSGELVFDSSGPEKGQSPMLREQFFHLIGKSSRVNAAAFSEGAGFDGLDASWQALAVERPEMAGVARAYEPAYGDARLDRMFTQGLDVLFGAEAGRAAGKTRDLRVGEEFTTKAERPGISMKPTVVDLKCKVVSARGGEVVVSVAWHLNGFDPEVSDDGAMVVRGGDIRSTATMTFDVASGVLVGLEEAVERTDQVSNGTSQLTRKVSERKTFRLAKP